MSLLETLTRFSYLEERDDGLFVPLRRAIFCRTILFPYYYDVVLWTINLCYVLNCFRNTIYSDFFYCPQMPHFVVLPRAPNMYLIGPAQSFVLFASSPNHVEPRVGEVDKCGAQHASVTGAQHAQDRRVASVGDTKGGL